MADRPCDSIVRAECARMQLRRGRICNSGARRQAMRGRCVIGKLAIGLVLPLCAGLLAPVGEALASPMEMTRAAPAGAHDESVAAAYFNEFEPLKALSQTLSRIPDEELVLGQPAGIDTIAPDFSPDRGGQQFEFSAPDPEPAPTRRRPGRDGAARNQRDEAHGPTVRQVFRVFINVLPNDGHDARHPAAKADPKDKDAAVPAKTGVGFTTTILNSTVDQDFIDIARVVLRPALTEGGGVRFSIAGFGDFGVFRSSETGAVTMVESQSGLAWQAYNGTAAPQPAAAPPGLPRTPQPPGWHQPASPKAEGPSLKTFLSDAAANPFVWMVAALIAISWMIWMVSTRRE